jgi:putative FmdB family regulatory protein
LARRLSGITLTSMEEKTLCSHGRTSHLQTLAQQEEFPIVCPRVAAYTLYMRVDDRRNNGAGKACRPSLGGKTMPSYEYHCRKCDETFDLHMTLKEHETTQPRCPQCQSTDVEQVMAAFTAVTSKKS